MTVPYSLRLLCLCLAAFALVHLAAGLVVAAISPAAIRLAARMRASRAAAFLFALRLLPAAGALAVVGGLCAPSYLWLEPRATAEEVGVGFLGMAVVGAAICGAAAARALSGICSLVRLQRHWKRIAQPESVAGRTALVMDEQTPLLALAGIFRPRLVASRAVLNTLGGEELQTAIDHEQAHVASRDNLKRLAFLLAPDLLPFWPALRTLEGAWRRFTEWAADDRAVRGDAERSLALAAALVRVARLRGAPAASPLITSLLADSSDLADRVNRLLKPASAAPAGRAWALPLLTLATIGVTAFATRQPEALYWAHRMLERLVH